jgi:hypothetical protein
MASYAGTGTERGRGGGGAGQAGYSGSDYSGATGGGQAAAQEAAQQAAQLAQRAEEAKSYAAAQRAAQLAAQQASQQAAQQAAAAEAERFARQQRIMQEQQTLSLYQPVRDSAGNIVGQVTPSQIPFGLTGLIAKALGIEQRVYSGDPMYNPFDVSNRFDTNDRGGFYNESNQQKVPPVRDPATGQARCPKGYVFHETLQACIMDTSATSPFAPESPNYIPPYTPPPTSSYFENQGLLGTPPSGILGTASDPYSYLRPYTQQRGYTLLS